jgi:hypothetical protein
VPLPVELPIAKHFSSERIAEIEKYQFERLSALKMSLQDLREKKITQWRRIYTGMPREKAKSFPWQNASNLVVQLVGAYVSQLQAKLIQSIFAVDPLYEVELVGDWDRIEHAEEQRQALQDWLGLSGMEPNRLNLLPKYMAWTSTIIRYGMGAMKLMPERTVEQVATSISSSGRVLFEERTRHDGPVAFPIIFEDFLMPLTVAELTRSPFHAQRARMSRFDLELMKHDPTYDKKAIEHILKTPDRQGSENANRELELDMGSGNGSSGEMQDEWDIYECYYPYQVGGKTFHLIATCHLETKKTMKAVFNWLPDNSQPFIKGVLGYDGERSYGFGFCEMLKDYQEEVSAIHNRRGDASTLSNTNIFRVGTGTQLDAQFSVYPNAIFPGESGAFEVIPLGRAANETIKDEQMTLSLATDRAGIGPSSSGAGSGTVNKKNAYSAMGTYSVMQEGDTRANLNKTEFKQSHILLGRQKLLYDANFGIPEVDLKAFGKQGKYLQMALDNVKDGRLCLPIRAATGSINKEVEKQNDMLLLNNLRSHWQMVSQILQSVESPMVSPSQKDYMYKMIDAANWVTSRIAKNFGIPDPSVAVPAPAGIEAKGVVAHKQAEQQTAMQISQQMQQEQQQGGQQQPGGQPPQQTPQGQQGPPQGGPQ